MVFGVGNEVGLCCRSLIPPMVVIISANAAVWTLLPTLALTLANHAEHRREVAADA